VESCGKLWEAVKPIKLSQDEGNSANLCDETFHASSAGAHRLLRPGCAGGSPEGVECGGIVGGGESETGSSQSSQVQRLKASK